MQLLSKRNTTSYTYLIRLPPGFGRYIGADPGYLRYIGHNHDEVTAVHVRSLTAIYKQGTLKCPTVNVRNKFGYLSCNKQGCHKLMPHFKLALAGCL